MCPPLGFSTYATPHLPSFAPAIPPSDLSSTASAPSAFSFPPHAPTLTTFPGVAAPAVPVALTAVPSASPAVAVAAHPLIRPFADSGSRSLRSRRLQRLRLRAFPPLRFLVLPLGFLRSCLSIRALLLHPLLRRLRSPPRRITLILVFRMLSLGIRKLLLRLRFPIPFVRRCVVCIHN